MTHCPRTPDPADTPGQPLFADASLVSARSLMSDAEVERWLDKARDRSRVTVERTGLEDMDGWTKDPDTGNITDPGQFSIEGQEVHTSHGPLGYWNQPVFVRREVDLLGFAAREFSGVLHLLVRAGTDPGSEQGVQLQPTVRLAGGEPDSAVPYSELFTGDAARSRHLVDIRQSEQGSWFYRRRSRNVVTEVHDDLEVLEDYCWLSLAQLHRFLAAGDVVSAATRSVLACLPFSGEPLPIGSGADGLGRALARSCGRHEPALHSGTEIQSWLTETRSRTDIRSACVPLAAVDQWVHVDGRIKHAEGEFFDLIGAKITIGGDAPASWHQALVAPCHEGLVALLVKEIGGVLHALVQAHVEAGYVDVVELGPTLQCIPHFYEELPREVHPKFLGEILQAGPDRVRFDATLSDNGSYFYHARNRYVIVETDSDLENQEGPGYGDFRWMTLHQLTDLLGHSFYVNEQARSLIACLRSLSTQSAQGAGEAAH